MSETRLDIKPTLMGYDPLYEDRYGKVADAYYARRPIFDGDGKPVLRRDGEQAEVQALWVHQLDREGNPWQYSQTSKRSGERIAEYSWIGSTKAVPRYSQLGCYLQVLEENFGFDASNFDPAQLIGKEFMLRELGYWFRNDRPNSRYIEVRLIPTAMKDDAGQWIIMENSPLYSIDEPVSFVPRRASGGPVEAVVVPAPVVPAADAAAVRAPDAPAPLTGLAYPELLKKFWEEHKDDHVKNLGDFLNVVGQNKPRWGELTMDFTSHVKEIEASIEARKHELV